MRAFFDPLWEFILASWQSLSNPRVRQPFKVVAPLISGATIFYHFVEDWSWIDSFYFSIVSLSTVGFGDLSPSTDAGKLFTIAYLVLGIAVLVMLVRAIAQYSIEEMTDQPWSRSANLSSTRREQLQEPQDRPSEQPEINLESQHG